MEHEFERQLRTLAIERRPEACLGCGFEHGCSVHGCAVIHAAAERLAAYEETRLEPEDMKKAFNEDATLKLAGQALGMSPDRLRELAQAEKEGRLVVLPRLHGKKLLRDGLEFEPNHWNITLTAFAHNQPTKSGKRVGLFSICEAAEAALEEREDKPCKS